MALTGWNDQLSVGHATIDDDHLKLIDLLDRLEDAVTNHLGLETYGKVLQELLTNTQAHFAMEEELMARHAYAGAEQHIREHQSLLQELDEFKSRFDACTVILSIAQLKSLEAWLTEHILTADKALAESLRPD